MIQRIGLEYGLGNKLNRFIPLTRIHKAVINSQTDDSGKNNNTCKNTLINPLRIEYKSIAQS